MIYATRVLVGVTVLIILLMASAARADTLTFSGADDISIEATDASGAIVTFDVTAEDASSTPFAVACDPASGSLFPIGTTTVNCEAVDSIGATSTTNFDVGVFEAATSTPHITIEGDVDVPASCDVVDTDGTSHHYEAASSTAYVGICALYAAKAATLISDFQATNFSFGLFVTSIHGVAADPASQFWALYHNGGFPSVGLTDLPIIAGDTILLQLEDFSGNHIGDSVTLHIATLVATSTPATSTPPVDPPPPDTDDGGGGSSDNDFDVEDALAFLSSKQNANGSYDYSGTLLSDWIAVSFAAQNPGEAKTKLKSYMLSASPSYSSVTDNERHAMALMALGINPYTGTSRDYIAPIISAFDGTQIGDPSLDNDDIFAVFPLMNAGYGTSDTIIQKTVAFIVQRQKADGSWDSSVDVTAAAIQALEMTSSLSGAEAAITKAENYLRSKQKEDGGWENSFSTSWALQAITALDQSLSSWTPGSDSPEEYLADLQQTDGGVDSTNTSDSMRIWATAYAIPAVKNKTWDSLLASFSKPKASTENANTVVGTTTSPTATTTVATLSATTTLSLATSTPLVLGAATSTLPITPPTPKPVAPAKSRPAVTTAKEPTTPTIAATSMPETAPQTQTAAVGSTQDKPNVFVRIWNFFKNLLGL